MLNEENLKSIVDSNSLSSVSLNYPTIQKIAKPLNLLMQDESNNSSLSNLLNALVDFLCWNEQCNQGIYEFMNQLMTTVVQNFEDLNPKLDSEEKIKQELIEIKKKWTEKLGNANRFRLLTNQHISECANDLLEVKYRLLPDLMKLIPDLEQTSNLPKVCTEMEPIIPILRILGRSLAGFQLNTLCNIMNSWIIANDIKSNLSNANFEFYPIFTSLSYVKEASPSMKNNKFTKQAELCFSTATKIGSSTKQVDNASMDELIKEITDLLLISNEVVKIDFVSSKPLLLENDSKINLSALNNKSMIAASELAQKIYKQTQNENENTEEIPKEIDQKMENLVLPTNEIKVVECSSINDAGVFAQLMLEDMSSDLYHSIFIQRIKSLMNLYKNNFPGIIDMVSQSELDFTKEEVKNAFLRINSYLSNVSDIEKSIKELKTDELICHFSILSYISSNISSRSIKMDTYLTGSIQYQQKLLESAIINQSKSSKPLNALSSPDIFRLINNLINLCHFSIHVSSILQILLSIKSTNNNVTNFDLFKHQNILQNELSLVKGGELLTNYVKTLSNDEISTQINWILNILEFLSSSYDDIINNETGNLSNSKIIKILSTKVKFEKINDFSSIYKLQSTLFKSMKKTELVLKLFFILQAQKVVHQIENLDEDVSNEISLNLMKTEIKSIFDQIQLCYSSNKLQKQIQSIEYERIKIQQIIVRHLITYLIKTSNLSNDDQLMNHYINEFIAFSESLIYANPIILNNQNIKKDFSISNIILENRIDTFLVKKSIEMLNDFSIFQLENTGQKSSKSKKQSKADMLTEEEANKCLNILSNVHQNGITEQNKSLIKQSSKGINSILVEELEQTKNLSNSKEDFIALITSANILDRICILERLETTGIKVNPPEKIEKSDNLDVLALTQRMKYNVSILQLRLSKLYQQSCGLNQQLVSIPQIGSVLQKTKKVKINILRNGIKIQMNLIDQIKDLENQISKSDSNNLILQQLLISDLITILGNKKSFKSNLTLKVEENDAEMRNKILDSVVELQKKDVVKDPQCLLGMKCEEYNSMNSKRLVFFDRSNRQMLSFRLRLLLNLCLEIYPKYGEIPKQNIFANLSDDEIIRIQECVKDMLFLSHNSTSIKKFLKGVNELDISRLVVLIQDLINRINEGQAKVTNLGDICLHSSINKSEINALMANAATKLMDELQNPSTEKSLNEEIEKLRHFSSHLMECDNTNCKEQLTSLLSIAPQVVAHLSALDNKSSLNPSKIMELCQLISNATTDKSKSKEFKEGTMNLYELINSICQTLQAFDDQDPYKSASKLYQSILEKDLPSIAKVSAEIKTNEKFKEFNDIIKPFYPTILTCFSTKTIQNDQFTNLSNSLLKYLNKSITSLFTILENLKSPLEAQPIIAETKPKTEKSCSEFIYKIQMNEQNEAMNDLQDSTALVSRSIASAIAGLQLTNTTQIGSFFSISHCANNVSRLLSLQTGGIEVLSSRPLLMKRAQRAYLRTITKMFDLVEFTSEENISKLEKNKLNLIKSCFIPYRTLVTAISCRCEYRVPKIYYQVISGRFNDFDKETNEIKKFCDVLISSTGDLESADKMKEVFNSLCIQFKETSEKLTNKDEIISITSTITQFTLSSSSLLNALVHVENFFETSSTGDFSSASLLPSIFEMPDVSKQSKSIEKDMKKYEDNHNITSKALQDINVSKSRNESLAKSISDLCRKQSSNLESALCVSYHLNNFSGVSQITSTCQDIVIQMNVLLKNIRMKFLNIECTRTNESIIHSIKKLVDDLFEKTKSSYQKFLSSEKLRKKQLASFTKVISPLEESLANLTKLRSEIDKLPNGQTKVYSTKLYDISTNYLDGLVKVMKISRDHPSKTVEPSSLNDFSSASCQAAQSSATAIEDIISKKGGSEDRVINTMSLFVQLNDQVRSIKCAEELKLVDVVSATTKLSQLVIDSAKAARDVKLAAKKKKDGKGSSLKSKTESEEIGDISEESISRRLILESRVLKAHYIHDYLQKKLSQIK